MGQARRFLGRSREVPQDGAINDLSTVWAEGAWGLWSLELAHSSLIEVTGTESRRLGTRLQIVFYKLTQPITAVRGIESLREAYGHVFCE